MVGRVGPLKVLLRKPKCDHYGKVGHEKSHCWELIGYPLNWESKRGGNARNGNPSTAVVHSAKASGGSSDTIAYTN